MDAYVEEIRKLKNKFSGLEIHHVDRDNMGADVLSKLGSTRAAVPPGVFVHELHHLSVKVQSLMKRVAFEEGKDILREIHEGVCGNHAASRTLVGKAYRSGFF